MEVEIEGNQPESKANHNSEGSHQPASEPDYPKHPLSSAWNRALLIAAGASLALMPLATPNTAYARGSSGSGNGGGGNAARVRDQNINVTGLMTSAIAAQEIFGDATLEIDLVKVMAPDGKISGQVTPEEMQLALELLTFDQHLVAQTSPGGMAGKVDRVGFDHTFEEVSDGIWKIRRPFAFDAELQLTIGDGRIEGVVKQPVSFDWKVSGSYDPSGNINFQITVPFGFDAHLSGTITPN